MPGDLFVLSLRLPPDLLEKLDKEVELRKRHVDPAYTRTRLIREFLLLGLRMEGGS